MLLKLIEVHVHADIILYCLLSLSAYTVFQTCHKFYSSFKKNLAEILINVLKLT